GPQKVSDLMQKFDNLIDQETEKVRSTKGKPIQAQKQVTIGPSTSFVPISKEREVEKRSEEMMTGGTSSGTLDKPTELDPSVARKMLTKKRGKGKVEESETGGKVGETTTTDGPKPTRTRANTDELFGELTRGFPQLGDHFRALRGGGVEVELVTHDSQAATGAY